MINTYSTKLDTRNIALIGVLGGITIFLGLTPMGFIPIGPTAATIMHIPVIIGAIMGGPVVGAFVGLIFGLSSLFNAITKPTVVSFAFLNPLISVLPRIIIGLGTAYIYSWVKEISKKQAKLLIAAIWSGISLYLGYGIFSAIQQAKTTSIIINAVLLAVVLLIMFFSLKKLAGTSLDVVISAAAGTLINTLLVLNLIYFLYGERFVAALGKDVSTVRMTILTIGVVNGIPEVIVAVILVTAVVNALRKKYK
ncbi:ECF transporter S component [Clostridiales bacterium COT073_COT-073]|nr:ECF transporter S component [Clostridiales bacterium COT073_COT-073]